MGRAERAFMHSSVDRPKVFTVPAARRHASPGDRRSASRGTYERRRPPDHRHNEPAVNPVQPRATRESPRRRRPVRPSKSRHHRGILHRPDPASPARPGQPNDRPTDRSGPAATVVSCASRRILATSGTLTSPPRRSTASGRNSPPARSSRATSTSTRGRPAGRPVPPPDRVIQLHGPEPLRRAQSSWLPPQLAAAPQGHRSIWRLSQARWSAQRQ